MSNIATPLRTVAVTLCAAFVAATVQFIGAPAAQAAGPLVAVLPNYAGVCPGGLPKYTLYQDNEDDNNENNRYGWIGGIKSDSNTRTYLCAVDGDRFRSLLAYRVNFAVPALGPTCPVGAITFDRYVDDEDDNSESWSNAPAGSGTRSVGGNTYFRFCWFLNYSTNAPNPPSSAFPYLGGEYGVFGPSTQSPAIQWGWVYTDDEDDFNENWVNGMDGTLTYYRSQWLTVGPNTTLRTVRVR